jgi:hypothetical protein
MGVLGGRNARMDDASGFLFFSPFNNLVMDE